MVVECVVVVVSEAELFDVVGMELAILVLGWVMVFFSRVCLASLSSNDSSTSTFERRSSMLDFSSLRSMILLFRSSSSLLSRMNSLLYASSDLGLPKIQIDAEVRAPVMRVASGR